MQPKQKGRGPKTTPFPFSDWNRRLFGSRSFSRSFSRSSGFSSSIGGFGSSVGGFGSSVGRSVSSGGCIGSHRISRFRGSFFGLFRASREGQGSAGSGGGENDLAHVIAILEQRVDTPVFFAGAKPATETSFGRTNNRHL